MTFSVVKESALHIKARIMALKQKITSAVANTVNGTLIQPTYRTFQSIGSLVAALLAAQPNPQTIAFQPNGAGGFDLYEATGDGFNSTALAAQADILPNNYSVITGTLPDGARKRYNWDTATNQLVAADGALQKSLEDFLDYLTDGVFEAELGWADADFFMVDQVEGKITALRTEGADFFALLGDNQQFASVSPGGDIWEG